MLNCNILDTTYLTMPLNFTQFNVSAKYELAILQFNVSDKHLVSDDSVDSMYSIFAWQAIHSKCLLNTCLSVTKVNMSAKALLAIADFHVSATYLSGNEKIIELCLLSSFLANAELQYIWYYLSEYVFEHHSIQCVCKVWLGNTSVQCVYRF